MNIFLVPYTWLRHIQVALVTSSAALLSWWVLLAFVWLGGAGWGLFQDGLFLLAAMAGATALASTLAEGQLRRVNPVWRLTRPLLAGAISSGLAAGWYLLWHKFTLPVLMPETFVADYEDPSLISLRFRLGAFAMAGLSAAIGPIVVRKGAYLLDHVIGGLAAGLAAGAVWHLCNFTFFYDLYLAGAASALAFGGTFGLLTWGIPTELYAGWLRVLRGGRYGHRIPIDALERGHKERFLGHFPRGLDMWLPVEEGVLELHASVVVDGEQNYKARGLTLNPVTVKRFLETIDLRYDPRRPAPLETRVNSGDRIVLGEGEQSVELEFLMLPREEG